MLRGIVDGPLPLEVDGRALPGHNDSQVCPALTPVAVASLAHNTLSIGML